MERRRMEVLVIVLLLVLVAVISVVIAQIDWASLPEDIYNWLRDWYHGNRDAAQNGDLSHSCTHWPQAGSLMCQQLLSAQNR